MTLKFVSRAAARRYGLASRNRGWLPRLVLAATCVLLPHFAPQAAAQPPNQAAAQPPNQDAANLFRANPFGAVQAARRTRLPLLDDLTQVKLDKHAGELQLIMMLESFRTDKRMGRVVKHVPVERTRMVPDGQGGRKEQTYTVHVARVEDGEVDVKIPAGVKPVTRSADQFRFFELSGSELSLEAATERLQTLQPAFLLDRFVGDLPEIPELYRQALKAECLVIVSEQALRDASQLPTGEILPARVLPNRIVPREGNPFQP